MKTILITGASSGIGKASVKLFSEKGWRVLATARNTDNMKDIANLPNVHLFALDVTLEDSVKKCITNIVESNMIPDVLVNNAGYSVTGVFEEAGDSKTRQQFEVNVFGLMNVTRAIIPLFRQQGHGSIINLSSVAGHIGMMSFSLYNSSKFAVEGYSESLWYELRPFNIQVKLIEPGPIKTDFYGRSMDVVLDEKGPYVKTMKPVIDKIMKMGNKGPGPERVAKTIFKAASSKGYRLRYPVGVAAVMIFARHSTPNCLFRYIMRKFMS